MIPDLSARGGEDLTLDEWDAAVIADVNDLIEANVPGPLLPPDSAWRNYAPHPKAGFIRFPWQNPAAWDVLASDVDREKFMSVVDGLMNYTEDASMRDTVAVAVDSGRGVLVINDAKYVIVPGPEMDDAGYEAVDSAIREVREGVSAEEALKLFHANTPSSGPQEHFNTFEEALTYAANRLAPTTARSGGSGASDKRG